MLLDVPLVRQPPDSVECGIAGITMLLQYYEIKKTFDEVKKDIPTDKIGTYAPQLGTYLLRHGFDVDIVTIHPAIFVAKNKGCTQQKVREIIEQHLKTCPEKDKTPLKHFADFLRSGGTITVDVPSLNHVREELDNKRPVGALLTSSFLTHTTPIFNFHFNILTGYDKDVIYANDPCWDERGGKKTYPITDFIYGLYASAYGDVDNACIIRARPRTQNAQ